MSHKHFGLGNASASIGAHQDMGLTISAAVHALGPYPTFSCIPSNSTKSISFQQLGIFLTHSVYALDLIEVEGFRQTLACSAITGGFQNRATFSGICSGEIEFNQAFPHPAVSIFFSLANPHISSNHFMLFGGWYSIILSFCSPCFSVFN